MEIKVKSTIKHTHTQIVHDKQNYSQNIHLLYGTFILRNV